MAVISIDGVVPRQQPQSYPPSRDLLDRDGRNRPIRGAELTYILNFGPMDTECYTEWYNLATSEDHTVVIPREDDFLPQRYTNAQVSITNVNQDAGVIMGMQIEIKVYQAPL